MKLVFLVAFVAMLAACQEAAPVEETVVRPVRVMLVGTPTDANQQSFTGVTKSSKEVKLSFRVAGTISDLKVNLGDEIKKGDVIGTLDSAEVSLQVQASQADLAKAEAQRKRYEADYQRAKSMFTQQVVNKAELDASRAFFESASADIDAARKALQLAQKRASYHRLRSRVGGTIAKVLSEENENVGAGEPIAILNAGERAEAEIAVPSRFIGRVRIGTKAKVTLTGLNGLVMEGVVSRVGVTATEAATTFPVKVRFTEADERIRSGMTVTATFETQQADGPTVFFIPPRAIVATSEGQTVFIAVPEPGVADRATIRVRQVTTGRPTIRGVEITSGLEDGDLVVLAGMSQIRDGLVVKLLKGSVPEGAERRLGETFPELSPPPGEDEDAKARTADSAVPVGSAAPSSSTDAVGP